MLKKASPKNDADDGKDVPADNPKGTMDRFAAGLKLVLSNGNQATTANVKKPPRR